MTVAELIERLQKENPRMKVVVDLHSEYAELGRVEVITGFENGGYVSTPYREEDKLRSNGYLRLGPPRQGDRRDWCGPSCAP